MTDERTLVSIVIPVHNGERFIARTLVSALSQTYSQIEAVVVDDGSSDRTGAIVEAAAANDSRIRYFRTVKSGVAATRNFGISKARGKLIAPLDADDLWHPEKIARQVEAMQASSEDIGLVYCWAIEIDENDFIIPSIKRLGRRPEFQGRVTADLATACFIHTSSAPLVKRSCIDAIGGYDPNLQPQGAEDWKFYLALSEICEFAVVPEYLVGYRQSSGSISKGHIRMARSLELVAHWITGKWPDLPEQLQRRRTYHINGYLAQLALSNNQFIDSLRYMARATKARRAALLERSTLEFVVRLLFRMTGLRGVVLRRHGLTFQPPVSYQEFSTHKTSRR